MINDSSAIRNYFAKLGLEREIADIYLALHVHGPQTISALARNSGVERTRIYRLIDKLLLSNLVEVETHYKRGIVKAAPVSNLHILIKQKEQELKGLQDELGLIEQVLARNSLSSPAMRVQFYQGPEGIKQMQWNLLRAQTEVLSIMYRPMQDVTGSAFFKCWAEKWNESNKSIRILLAPQFLEISSTWHTKNPSVIAKAHYSRVLTPDKLQIKFATDIYDDVVSYYNWKDGEVFGIEIYNQDVADAQRAFFETLWEQAVVPDVDLGRTQEED